MKIIIAGSSGLVGSALVDFLTQQGHQPIKLKRDQKDWDPSRGVINPNILEGADAIVNFSGENIAARWTAKKKQAILESRISSTKLLAETISQLKNPPKIYINASAIGYYGNHGDQICTEETPKGQGFLADVCQQWEEATLPAEQHVRVVKVRFGVILSQKGGMLTKLLLPFKLGLGGVVGNGSQYMSWIDIDDLTAIILYLIESDLKGAINVVSPQPVTNKEFTKILGEVLSRPTVFPVPAAVMRLVLGEMADEMILSSTRAVPDRLLKVGYHFKYPDLFHSLKHLIV